MLCSLGDVILLDINSHWVRIQTFSGTPESMFVHRLACWTCDRDKTYVFHCVVGMAMVIVIDEWVRCTYAYCRPTGNE